MKVAILILIFAVNVFEHTNGADVSVPFTHSFTFYQPGWFYQTPYWTYSGLQKISDLTHVPLFQDIGYYMWTQQSQPADLTYEMEIASPKISNVSKQTKFHIRYWFSTTNLKGKHGIFFYVGHLHREQADTIEQSVTTSANQWRELTIDCQKRKCCETEPCTVRIWIIGYVGGANGDGLAAIQCVSTEDNGCAPNGFPNTTSTKNPTGNSAWTATPNHLLTFFIAFISLTVQNLQ